MDDKQTAAVKDDSQLRTLSEVLGDGYRVANRGANGEFIVVQQYAEDPEPPPEPLRQMSAGMGGQTRYATMATEDYNQDFLHLTKALYETVREMRNDGQVRNSLRLAKSPVLGARWFVKPASQEPDDVEKARFIEWNLETFMSSSFYQVMVESLLMLDYGWFVFEKVFDIVPDPVSGEPRVAWKRLVPIHPVDITEPLYDDDGGPAGIKLDDENETEIPIEKLLIFTFDKEGGNVMGNSILRSAYKHWFFKENLYKIDAIQKERHGVGVPIIKLPMNAGPTDRTLAHTIGMNLRTNESAHVVIPPLWEIEFAKLEGQRVDALESAQHHGEMIYENVMGRGIFHTGPRQMSGAQEMFLKSSRYTAEIIKDVWNKYAIPQLCNWSWDEFPNGYPSLDVRRLGDTTDWRQMSFAMRNFVGMKALTPDDALEEWVRDEMDLPIRDESTAREIDEGGQQVPGSTSSNARVGLPRQTPTAGVARGTGNPGRSTRDVGGA